MRDAIDSQIWVDHHHSLSDLVHRSAGSLRSGLRKQLAGKAEFPNRFLTGLAALGMTLLTLGGSAGLA